MTDARKPVDRVERLEEELALVRAAQKKYAEFTQEQVDRIFFAAAMAAGKMPAAGQDGRRGDGHGRGGGQGHQKPLCFRIYIQCLPRRQDLRRDRGGQGLRHHPPGRASGRDRGRDSHHQPHLHGHFQDAGLPENPQRHHHLPPPARQEVHGRGRAHRAGGRGGGRRAGAHHLLDRRAQPGDDQPHHVRVRLHVGHGRPGHGALGLLQRQAGAGRGRGQRARRHRRERGHSARGQLHHPLQDL